MEFVDTHAHLDFDYEEGKTVEELYLDHDLGEENGIPITIMPLVDYLVETGLEKTNPVIENIIVHTSNPAGKNTMVQALSINRLNGTYKVTSGDAHDLGLGMPVFRPRRYRETDIGY